MTRRAGLDQESVIEGAAALADKDGLEQLTLASLASHLGIRTPSLYNHVEGLPGLRRELALLGTRQLVKQLGRAVMGKAGDDAIMALAKAYRNFGKEHPGLYTAAQQGANPNDVELSQVQSELIDIVVRTLSFYAIAEDRVIHTVRGMRSAIHGFVSLELAGGFGLPLDLDESFRLLMTRFLQGLKYEVQPNKP